MSGERIPLADLRALVAAAFEASRTSSDNARSVADALVAAEADGLSGHGLSRVAAYCGQALSGKVDGHAVPRVERRRAASVLVDAGTGFAFPAFEAAIRELSVLAPQTGVAAAAIGNSHHFGVAGHHVERLADAGLVALVFGNSPAAIAPWGGKTPLFGTDPIAFACPRPGGAPLVVDLSMSKVARGRVMVAAQKGEPIPEGWALDAEGRPTTDAKAALAGAMLPMGDAKGAALVMAVELLSVAFTGSSFGWEASSFFDAEGPAPRVGQLLLAIDPGAFGPAETTLARIGALCGAVLAQPGTRLPGDRRLALRAAAERDGIAPSPAVLEDIRRRAAGR
jgi:(2R)-3-sulfolactate dehydrogenase (NADP+)